MPAIIGISYFCHLIRILIFFDDGFAQYLLPKSVHFVYEKSVTFDACYADMKLFLKEYFKIYPKRLMVRLKMGDHLKVERFGKLVAATVVQVDCSLVKVRYYGTCKTPRFNTESQGLTKDQKEDKDSQGH